MSTKCIRFLLLLLLLLLLVFLTPRFDRTPDISTPFTSFLGLPQYTTKARFYKAFNNIFGKIGRNASGEVLFALIKSKCLPILLYGIEACPTNSADLQSLQFTMNKILFKILGAMGKEMFREISKCFGINPLKEVISARRDKFLKRYCALDHLCQLLHDKH